MKTMIVLEFGDDDIFVSRLTEEGQEIVYADDYEVSEETKKIWTDWEIIDLPPVAIEFLSATCRKNTINSASLPPASCRQQSGKKN